MRQLWDRVTELSPAKRELLAALLTRDDRLGRFMRAMGSPLEPMTEEQMSAEVRLDDNIRGEGALSADGNLNCVLLSGATGFLGAFLANKLLTSTSARVICLVRASGETEARERILQNLRSYGLTDEAAEPRIVPLVGDLSQPLLGLSEQRFDWLAGEIEAVYHCGAVVKWTYPYSTLNKDNVLGTHELLRLAVRGRLKPFHFVSTVGVFASGRHDRTIFETTPIESSGTLHIGYAQSKWVAEKLVASAGERGVPVTIYRPNVGPHSLSGAFNPNDHVSLMIKGCVQLGAYPDLPMRVSGAPVDYVVSAMVNLSRRPESLGRVFHLVNRHDISWNNLIAWFAAKGYRMERLPHEEWRQRLLTAIRLRQENALVGLAPLFSEFVLSLVRLPQFDDAATRAALRPMMIACPGIDANILETYLAYYRTSGFLPEPA